MSMEIFLVLLLAVSVLTGLFTQALKSVFEEHKINYYANTLAGIVSGILSVALTAGYAVITEAAVNQQYVVYGIALLALSWLSAMVGYDKVVQAITQIKTYSKDNTEAR